MASNLDIAWAGGLFEGEGCFTSSQTSSGRWTAIACLYMADEEIVRKFAEIVGVGNVTFTDRSKYGAKDLWMWRSATAEKFKIVFELLEPYLGERRRARANEILSRDLAGTPRKELV